MPVSSHRSLLAATAATLCLTTTLLCTTIHIARSDDSTVSFNPCAHAPPFIDAFAECFLKDFPEKTRQLIKKKIYGVPGLTSQEVFVLTCRANKGAGDMLFGEFLKELEPSARPAAKKTGYRCHKEYEHM